MSRIVGVTSTVRTSDSTFNPPGGVDGRQIFQFAGITRQVEEFWFDFVDVLPLALTDESKHGRAEHGVRLDRLAIAHEFEIERRYRGG